MKVKFKTGISGLNYAYSPGDTADFDKKQAIRFCEAGIARPVKEKDIETSNKEYPKHTGGGWYELSNKEKIQGKENAIKAENKIER